MSKVTLEQAKFEVDSWLDHKKIGENKRLSNAANIEALVNAVADGELVLEDNKNWTLNLKFPLTGEIPVAKLEFKPRLTLQEIHTKLEGVKTSDGDGRVLAYVAALTGKPKQVIKALDSEDYNVPQAIAVFFL